MKIRDPMSLRHPVERKRGRDAYFLQRPFHFLARLLQRCQDFAWAYDVWPIWATAHSLPPQPTHNSLTLARYQIYHLKITTELTSEFCFERDAWPTCAAAHYLPYQPAYSFQKSACYYIYNVKWLRSWFLSFFLRAMHCQYAQQLIICRISLHTVFRCQLASIFTQ